MWAESPKNHYIQMAYENGEPCWQEGLRSTKVSISLTNISVGGQEEAGTVNLKAHFKQTTERQNQKTMVVVPHIYFYV